MNENIKILSSKSFLLTYFFVNVKQVISLLYEKFDKKYKVLFYAGACHKGNYISYENFANTKSEENLEQFTHCHVYIRFQKKMRTRNLRIFDLSVNDSYVPCNLQFIKNTSTNIVDTVFDYVFKDIYDAKAALDVGIAAIHPDYENLLTPVASLEKFQIAAANLALKGNINEALQLIKLHDPDRYINNFLTLKANFEAIYNQSGTEQESDSFITLQRFKRSESFNIITKLLDFVNAESDNAEKCKKTITSGYENDIIWFAFIETSITNLAYVVCKYVDEELNLDCFFYVKLDQAIKNEPLCKTEGFRKTLMNLELNFAKFNILIIKIINRHNDVTLFYIFFTCTKTNTLYSETFRYILQSACQSFDTIVIESHIRGTFL